MAILDQLLNNFFSSQGFEQFMVEEEGSTAIGSGGEKRTASEGNTFVLKEDPNTGNLVRLERPQDTPTTFNERLGEFNRPEPQQKQGFNILKSLGQITGFGSPLWDKGLDIDLKKGDPVPSPVSGTVVGADTKGGFGRQVRIKGDDGREYWMSHLDASQVRPGERINAGQQIGLGGNSGNVIPGPGGDGSHLDVTVKDPSGSFISPQNIKNLFSQIG